MKTLERNEQRKFETACFSILNIDSWVPHWRTPETVHERSMKESNLHEKYFKERMRKMLSSRQVAIAVSAGAENAWRHHDWAQANQHLLSWTKQDLKFVQVGLQSRYTLPWVCLKRCTECKDTLVSCSTAHFCSRGWLRVAHLVSTTEQSPNFLLVYLLISSLPGPFPILQGAREKMISWIPELFIPRL